MFATKQVMRGRMCASSCGPALTHALPRAHAAWWRCGGGEEARDPEDDVGTRARGRMHEMVASIGGGASWEAWRREAMVRIAAVWGLAGGEEEEEMVRREAAAREQPSWSGHVPSCRTARGRGWRGDEKGRKGECEKGRSYMRQWGCRICTWVRGAPLCQESCARWSVKAGNDRSRIEKGKVHDADQNRMVKFQPLPISTPIPFSLFFSLFFSLNLSHLVQSPSKGMERSF